MDVSMGNQRKDPLSIMDYGEERLMKNIIIFEEFMKEITAIMQVHLLF